MRNGLYPKLAARSMRQNHRFFVPYLLALAGLTAAFYVMAALVFDPGVVTMRGFAYVQVMMQIGMFVAGILSAVLLLYINSFLMKQRKKELGLYNILGMGKGNIALIQCWESLYTALIGILGGLVLGVIFHKLATIGLTSLLQFSIPFHSSLSLPAMIVTAIFFGALLVLALLLNLFRVRLSKPIELLHGGNVGEKEPRTRWLMAVIGALAMGVGYFIAVTTKDPALAMAFYFLAVILVIIGTYCLFTAGSIALLKMLRKNKGFYYQTGHFIGVSGMLYRMKRNAVGLANICILSTMVMVMISGTLSLYLGQGEIIAAQFPADLNMIIDFDPAQGETLDWDGAERLIQQFVQEHDTSITDYRATQFLRFNVLPDPNTGCLEVGRADEAGPKRAIYVITAADYAALTGQPAPILNPGEAASAGGLPEGFGSSVAFQGFQEEAPFGAPAALAIVQDLPAVSHFALTFDMVQPLCLVLPDQAAWEQVCKLQHDVLEEFAATPTAVLLADLDCTTDKELDLMDAWYDALIDNPDFLSGTGSWTSWRTEFQAEASVDGYSMAGGFLFLGIVLGIVFLMATVLIIYYKQVSEGYEDQGRFEIMRKVGLSQREVKSSIRSQVLIVFFLPIVVAAIHLLFDFNLVARMLTMFGVRNVMTVALCTGGTLAAFLAVYAVVYLLTARTYYKIVR
ncbi:MAG: ABC transporter permease [Oscillospiraceae bacterium]|nr:ABC transporter permease [Oscillospiraceae bacterium]